MDMLAWWVDGCGSSERVSSFALLINCYQLCFVKEKRAQ